MESSSDRQFVQAVVVLYVFHARLPI